MFAKARQAAQYIKENTNNFQADIAMVLGSGLGDFAKNVEDAKIISYEDIPHFHKTSVVGHKGKLVYGNISGHKVIVFQGRFHAYEGHDQEIVCLPTRTVAALGIKKILITNAAGGMGEGFAPGDLVSIQDHINFTGRNPLVGPNDDEFGPRFPDMSEAYSKRMHEVLKGSAQELDIELKEGVYAGFLGPTYETPAEVQMAKIVGAHMVGMSTVPEVISANHAGIEVCGISCITNLAAGIGTEKLDHAEVKEVANLAMNKFTTLILKFMERL